MDFFGAIALSKTEMEQYRSRGVRPAKVFIIPNGIDPDDYTELPPLGAFRKTIGVSEYQKIILYLGRVHKVKGLDFLLSAYSYMRKQSDNRQKNTLVIAGMDDGFLSQCKNLAKTLGVAANVIFTGPISVFEKMSALVDASLCVYLDPTEPFGLVPFEAASCNKPSIVVEGTPMSEIIREGHFGFSVKYGDFRQSAMLMRNLLIHKNTTNELGCRGRSFVYQNFTWEKIVSQYESLYLRAAS